MGQPTGEPDLRPYWVIRQERQRNHDRLPGEARRQHRARQRRERKAKSASGSWQLYEQAKAEFMRIKPTASADEIEEAVRAILEMNQL